MLLFTAAAVLLVTVALMVVRPLLAPPHASPAASPAAETPDASPAAETPDASPPSDTPTPTGPPAGDATDRAALEALIAERRLRMEHHATGAGR
jgi:hypothetical protein